MAPDPPSLAAKPRLNPFAFPSDTDFRFVLLVVSLLGTSLFLFDAIAMRVPPVRSAWLQTEQQCAQLLRQGIQDFRDRPAAGATLREQTAKVNECQASANRPLGILAISGLGVMLAVAGVFYWLLPYWKIRRGRLVPLSSEDAPEVLSHFQLLCQETGVARPPAILWNPLNRVPDAFAFGRAGRYYVALSGGLVTQFYTDRPKFQARLLHELAHVRNADIDKTCFSLAISLAFVLVALLPFAVGILQSSSDASIFLGITARGMALSALAYLTLAALLRSRELYADVRASVWDGADGSLRRTIQGLSSRRANTVRRLLDWHPARDDRLRVLDSTDTLFRVGFWPAFATGVAAAVALGSVSGLFQNLTGEPLASVWWAALLYASLAVGILGVGIWRATFAAKTHGRTSVRLVPVAIGLTLGIIAGQYVALEGALDSFSLASLGVDVVWGAIAAISLMLFLAWVEAGAASWLPVAVGYRSPRPFYSAGLLVAAGVLTAWFGLLFLHWGMVRGGSGAVAGGAVLLVQALGLAVAGYFFGYAQHPLTVLVLASLWAYPLAANLWRGRAPARVRSAWVFLSNAPAPVAVRQLTPVDVRGPALTCVVGTLVFCALMVLLGKWLPPATDDAKILHFYLLVGLAALTEAAIAAVVAVCARRVGVLLGIAAAWIGGCLMAASFILVNLAFGGSADPAFVWNVLSSMISYGAALAIPAAIVGSAVARTLRRGARDEREPVEQEPGLGSESLADPRGA